MSDSRINYSLLGYSGISVKSYVDKINHFFMNKNHFLDPLHFSLVIKIMDAFSGSHWSHERKNI